MFKRQIVLLAMVLSLAGLGRAVAQDTQPAVTSEPAPVGIITPTAGTDISPVFQSPDPNTVINAAFLALLAAFSTGILSPLTATVVGLVKRIPLGIIQSATADQINLAVAILLSLGMWTGRHFGFGQQVATGYQLLYAVLPILTGAGANFLSNQKVYEAVKGNIPVVGYERTPKV